MPKEFRTSIPVVIFLFIFYFGGFGNKVDYVDFTISGILSIVITFLIVKWTSRT